MHLCEIAKTSTAAVDTHHALLHVLVDRVAQITTQWGLWHSNQGDYRCILTYTAQIMGCRKEPRNKSSETTYQTHE